MVKISKKLDENYATFDIVRHDLMNWKEINKKYKSKIQKGLGIEIGTGE